MKNGLQKKLSYACLALIFLFSIFVCVKIITNRFFLQSTDELLSYQPDIQYFNNSDGQFPQILANIAVTKNISLDNYMWSSPDQCEDKEKLDLYRLAFKANITKDYAKKLKQEVVPELKKLVGNYKVPDFADYKPAGNLPSQPNFDYYRDTLLKMVLSSTRFMVKKDYETALLMSYSAIRASEFLETNYSAGGSAETKRITNSIIRYACCQMLVDIPDTELDPEFYRAISNDLIKMANSFEPVSRTVDFNKNTLIDIIDCSVSNGNYAASKLNKKKFINNLDFFFDNLRICVDKPYREKGTELSELLNEYHEYCEAALGRFNKESKESSVANALVYRYMYDFDDLKKEDEKTLVLLEGTSIILALRGAILDKRRGKIKDLDGLEQWLGTKLPIDRLSGEPFVFSLTKKGISLISVGYDGIEGTDDDINFVPKFPTS